MAGACALITTARRLAATAARLPATVRPACSTTSIWASSALTKTSTGAPLTIWRESTFEPAKLNVTDPPAAVR